MADNRNRRVPQSQLQASGMRLMEKIREGVQSKNIAFDLCDRQILQILLNETSHNRNAHSVFWGRLADNVMEGSAESIDLSNHDFISGCYFLGILTLRIHDIRTERRLSAREAKALKKTFDSSLSRLKKKLKDYKLVFSLEEILSHCKNWRPLHMIVLQGLRDVKGEDVLDAIRKCVHNRTAAKRGNKEIAIAREALALSKNFFGTHDVKMVHALLEILGPPDKYLRLYQIKRLCPK